MALAESQGEPLTTAPSGHEVLKTARSACSLSSIRSLRDIPFVESSFDGEFDTILGNHSNLAASFLSTPKFTRHNTDTNSLGSPLSAATATATATATASGAASQYGPDLPDTSLGSVRSNNSSSSTRPPAQLVPSMPSRPLSVSQAEMFEEITKTAGAVASMNDYIGTWAPTAHYVVVAAAALRRDAAAFATSLTDLLNVDRILDPNAFAGKYYQLREAYSSLLSLGDFSRVIYGQQGWTRASSSTSNSSTSSATQNAGARAETTWDDRQLVDSFVTLLRTAPGFLASAILQMADSELTIFCADKDDSALSVLFHGVLGSAHSNRPIILAETLRLLHNDDTKHAILAKALLYKFIGLAPGALALGASTKLERYLLASLQKGATPHEFRPVLSACVPNELVLFLTHLSQWDQEAHTLLTRFGYELIVNPHKYGVLNEMYISETVRSKLEVVAEQVVKPAVDTYLDSVRKHGATTTTTTSSGGTYWKPDELIALKGSDLILMYNSLLPYRGAFGSVAASPTSEEDEWCLDSIRSDLVHIMQGLAHSTNMKSDGWQIFKVGIDGLVTDLANDMGLSAECDEDNAAAAQIIALCESLALFDAPTLSGRFEAARQDSLLRGDHLTLLNLEEAEGKLSEEHVAIMERHFENLRDKCRYLRNTLDQAALEQRRERERLSKLLAILDSARVHVWYECEVRPSILYGRSRDLLAQLYPNRGDDEDDKLPERSFSGENLYSSSVSSSASSSAGGATSGGGGGGGGIAAAAAASVARSRRLSILSSHSVPESPFYTQFASSLRLKLADKEVDTVLAYMRRHRTINMIPGEERFHRALVEVANLAAKLLDRDHIASYITFKRDRHYQTVSAAAKAGNRNSHHHHNHHHHHRRSSLGLFDFFEGVGGGGGGSGGGGGAGGNSATNLLQIGGQQQSSQLNLHTTTSTQFLGLASSSSDSLRGNRRQQPSTDDTNRPGPPRSPSTAVVQAILLSDLLRSIMSHGTETDAYMMQTGRMLLEGDGQFYQPLLDDISLACTPLAKLRAVEALIHYTRCVMQRKMSLVSRADVIQELSRSIGREPGTLFRDLQVISTFVSAAVLDTSDDFHDVCSAARAVMNTVIVRSMDYAARFMRYYLESSSHTAPIVATMGITDSVAIWEVCAKQGNSQAQQKLSELYLEFPFLKLELKPLSRPSLVLDGVDNTSALHEAVASHWMAVASQL